MSQSYVELNEILLMGAGGHAASCIDVIESEGRFRVAGLIAAPTEIGSEVCGYKVIGSDRDLEQLRSSFSNILIALGHISTAQPRVQLFLKLMSLNYFLPPVISPKAHVSKLAVIGEGTIIMPGALVNSRAKIGENCIINSSAIVEHDSVIGAHTHISTGVIVNGGVTIGEETFVGSGSIIKQGIAIGERSKINMGSVVTSNWTKTSSATFIEQ